MTALCLGILYLLNGCAALDPTDYPLLLTWYNPQFGGINADSDPSTFADGTAVTSDQYYMASDLTAAACPAEMLGAILVLPDLVDGHGDWLVRCRDTGPAIAVKWNTYHGRMVTHLDVMARAPIPCNYCVVHTWGVLGWGDS